MKLSLILSMWLVVSCACLMSGEAAEKALPKLEIISAIYGKAPETADITETIRNAVQGGVYLNFHNHPRWTRRELKIPNADKKIHLVYKLGDERKELECRYNARIKLGTLPPKFQFGTPEWIEYFIDFSGAGLVYARVDCPKCRKAKTVDFRPSHEDPLKCRECGLVISEKTFPTTGADVFEGMKLEYHMLPDGTKFYWKPVLRNMKAHHAYLASARMRGKGPEIGRKRLNTMLAYAKFFKKHIIRKNGKRISRPGYPYHCNWGRIYHFGDYVYPASYCQQYEQIEQSGVRITPEERAQYRSLVEDIISEIMLPFIRQWRGMGNPMGQAFADCIRVGRTFPEARIIDYYTPDEKGKPRILSGTDLVYETVQGRNGLENLVSTYWYSDGLMHEPTVAYQRMLAGGVSRALRTLEGFQAPAGYDPVKRGYQPFPANIKFLERPELRLPLNKHWEVVFPNGGAIPFGDSMTGIVNKNPPQNSEVYPGWGIGVFRNGNTAVAMNWGNLRDGHSHNDMLDIIFWTDGLFLLNTTGYPANEPKMPIQYWRGGAGAHNTVMVDGKNHERACGGPGAWGISDHLKVMQGFSEKSHPGAVLRRTAFFVNSRPGLPPYLVDFYQADGGKESHDYFLLVQGMRPDPQEKMEVLSPQLKATGKATFAEEFANAEKADVYPFIRNPASGNFAGNGEVLWTLPYEGALYRFRVILVPESIGSNTLYTGDAPGIRATGRGYKDPLDRTVKRVIWRRGKAPSEKEMHSCFMAAYEYTKDRNKLDLKDVKRLNVSGTPASRAAEVTHGSGKDILLLSDGNGVMSVNTSAGRIVFDGIAALLSLDRSGKLLKATTTGGRSLEVNGKRIPVGTLKRGKLAGLPSGLSEWLQNEKNATVVAEGRIPQELIGQLLIVRHKTGTTSYKITGVKALSGNRTELELNRSARKVIAVVDVAPNRKDMTILSGGTHEFIAPGNNFVVDGKTYKVQSIDVSRCRRGGGKTLGYATLKLEKPLPESGEQRIPVTEFSADDPYTVMASRTVELTE